jgi:hypothetical protein
VPSGVVRHMYERDDTSRCLPIAQEVAERHGYVGEYRAYHVSEPAGTPELRERRGRLEVGGRLLEDEPYRAAAATGRSMPHPRDPRTGPAKGGAAVAPASSGHEAATGAPAWSGHEAATGRPASPGREAVAVGATSAGREAVPGGDGAATTVPGGDDAATSVPGGDDAATAAPGADGAAGRDAPVVSETPTAHRPARPPARPPDRGAER